MAKGFRYAPAFCEFHDRNGITKPATAPVAIGLRPWLTGTGRVHSDNVGCSSTWLSGQSTEHICRVSISMGCDALHRTYSTYRPMRRSLWTISTEEQEVNCRYVLLSRLRHRAAHAWRPSTRWVRSANE